VPVTFIGDIHGWSDRLDRVLARAEGDLVFMGDLIDRGPDAPGVVARVRTLCEAGRARCLMGNHEYALLRALGVPEHGIEPEETFFEAWRDGFGGLAVLHAFGVGDAESLRGILGDTLGWLAALPWVLEGSEGERRWIAVHAGLDDERPLAEQVAELRCGWAAHEAACEALFSKQRALSLPPDFPHGCCLVSGHVVMPEARVTPERILCDTSGGQQKRVLSGVIWPAGRVVTSGEE
jgi:hypothetical protein